MKDTFNWSGENYSSANAIQTSVGERLLDTICFSPDMSVLDAGCGSGDLTFLLARKVPQGKAIGIDSSESMIRKAKKTLTEQNVSNLEFRVCSINEIDFKNQFDLVFSNSVLHWILEIEVALRKLFTALKHGGMLQVQFPLLNSNHPLIGYAARAIGELGLAGYYGNRSFPWYVPESKELFTDLLKKTGFIHAEVEQTADDFSFPSALAVYRHFNSVGLDLYAAPLKGKDKRNFKEQVIRDLTEDFPHEASPVYERIYAKAEKL